MSVVPFLTAKAIEVKDSPNCKISYKDYVHVCNTLLVTNNKTIFKVNKTQ